MNITQTKSGGHWIIQQDTHVGAWIEQSGRLDHDRHLHALIEELLTQKFNEGHKNLCVIDCGALYGDTSIAMSRAIGGGDGACCICIEANPMAFECLKLNSEKFQSQVILINACVGDDHGGKAVHTMEDMNVGAARVSELKEESSKIQVTIPTISLDGLVIDSNLESGFQFLKIDCEGYEEKILLGAKNSILKFKPLMVIEMNSFALSLQDSSYKQVYDLLLEYGYQWRIIQPESQAVPSSPQYDILCWPNPEPEKPKLYKAELINPAP